MPGNFTTYGADASLNLACRLGAGVPAAPTQMKVNLHTADPGITGSAANVVTGGGYTEENVTFGTLGDGPATSRQCSNTAAVTFGPSTGAWSGGASITHFSVEDQLSTHWFHSPLTAPQTVDAADITLEFAIGALICRIITNAT